MIVVDTNVIAGLYLPLPSNGACHQLAKRDGDWAVPWLWRSELRSVLATCVRRRQLNLHDAVDIQHDAEQLVKGREYQVPSWEVLSLAAESGCTAYDCEFIVLARQLGVSCYTDDRQLLERFAPVARALPSSA